MRRRHSIHQDVGVYALGALDNNDSARFEDHLVGCDRCAEELESLLPIVTMLSVTDLKSWVLSGAIDDGPPATTTPPATATVARGTSGPEVAGAGERFSITDPDTGVHADVILEDNAWGTQMSLALASLPGPATCRLVVVGVDDSVEVAATWWVPPDGYGTRVRPAPLTFHPATAVPQADIAYLQVQTVHETGAVTTLVTLSL